MAKEVGKIVKIEAEVMPEEEFFEELTEEDIEKTDALLREVQAVQPNMAVISPTARFLGTNIFIGPRTVISDYVVVYDNTVIGQDVYVGPHTVLGAPTSVGYSDKATVVMDRVAIGAQCVVENGTIVYHNMIHGSILFERGIFQRVLRFIARVFYGKRTKHNGSVAD